MRNGIYTSPVIVKQVRTWIPETNTALTSGTRCQVSSSAIIKSDYRTNNAWSYAVDLQIGDPLGHATDRNIANNVFLEYYGYGRGRCSASIPFFDNNFYNRCLDKMNDQVRGSIDLSIDTAQGKKSVSMINPIKKITDTVRKAKKGIIKGGAGLISDNYLEWKYGWQPTLQTIYELADKNRREALNKSRTITVRSGQSFRSYQSRNWTIFIYGGDLNFTCRTSVSEVYGCTIQVVLGDNYLPSAATFTSLNPASIAWELLPYSFVVDWFYDVGGYLRNMETALLMSGRPFISGFVSKLSVRDSAPAQSSVRFTQTGEDWTVRPGNISHRYTKFDRTILSSYPQPMRPKFKTDLGSTRLLNAAALLGSFLGR